MIPIVASVLLSVAGQFAYKLASSLWSKVGTPSVDPGHANIPRDEFSVLLEHAQSAPAPAAAAAPVLLAASSPGLPLAGAPRVARADLPSAVGAYQRMQNIEAP